MCEAATPVFVGPASNDHEKETPFCDPAEVHETANPLTSQLMMAIGGGGVGDGVTTGGGGVAVGGGGVEAGVGAGVGRGVGEVVGRGVAAGLGGTGDDAGVGAAVGAAVTETPGDGTAAGADAKGVVVPDGEGSADADGAPAGEPVGLVVGSKLPAAVSDDPGLEDRLTMAGKRPSSVAFSTAPSGRPGRSATARSTTALTANRRAAESRHRRRREVPETGSTDGPGSPVTMSRSGRVGAGLPGIPIRYANSSTRGVFGGAAAPRGAPWRLEAELLEASPVRPLPLRPPARRISHIPMDRSTIRRSAPKAPVCGASITAIPAATRAARRATR